MSNTRGSSICLLYTSDAADERSSVDLGGRRIIKKKKKRDIEMQEILKTKKQYESHRVKDGCTIT